MAKSSGISTRESESLDSYLHEIGKEKLITPDDEVRLAKEIQKGSQRALEDLTKANLRFVVSVAKQYQNQGLSLGDLINEGNLGLIKAAKRFDETRGFKFISYAVWWIRQSILQALAEQSRIVRLTLNRVGALNKIGKELSKLEQEYERLPSAHELAESLEMTVGEVADTLKISGRDLSMDAPFAQGEDNRLLDVLENEEIPNPDFSRKSIFVKVIKENDIDINVDVFDPIIRDFIEIETASNEEGLYAAYLNQKIKLSWNIPVIGKFSESLLGKLPLQGIHEFVLSENKTFKDQIDDISKYWLN